VAAQLAASQEGLSSMELVSYGGGYEEFYHLGYNDVQSV
jgi:hypothetical protein